MNIVKELRKGAGFESHHRHQRKNPAPIKGSGFFFFIAFFCGVIFDSFPVIFDGFPVKFEKESGHENGHEKTAPKSGYWSLRIARSYKRGYAIRRAVKISFRIGQRSSGSRPAMAL